MARSRNPVSVTIPLGASPPEDATLEDRTRYLLQMIGEEAGFLEQWIVHYLADLLELTNDRKTASRARSEARAEMARVIPILWEQQITREALHVRYKVDYELRHIDNLDSEAKQLLSSLLADPDRVAYLEESDVADAFRSLHTLAERVTRFFLTIDTAEKVRQEVTSEAVRRFFQRDEEVQRLQTVLAQIIPDFAALDPTDPDAVGNLVQLTLLALTQVQLKLLTHVSSDPPGLSETKKKRGGKGRGLISAS